MARRESAPRNLLVIALDKSGSMADGFHPPGNPTRGYVTYGPHSTKLDAAKKATIAELGDVAAWHVEVIAFDSTAQRVWGGRPTPHQVPAEIASLEAGGGTNIAAALDLAHRLAAGPEGYDTRNLVVISDGLDDNPAALLAAKRCADDGLKVHMVLIDPDPRTEDFAVELTKSGSYRAVGSSKVSDSHGRRAERVNAPRPASGAAAFGVEVAGTFAAVRESVARHDRPRRRHRWAVLGGAAILLLALLVAVGAARQHAATGEAPHASPPELPRADPPFPELPPVSFWVEGGLAPFKDAVASFW